MTGDRRRIRPSLSFLSEFRKGRTSLELGAHVVVVGGGNTAMDSARAATRVKGWSRYRWSIVARSADARRP